MKEYNLNETKVWSNKLQTFVNCEKALYFNKMYEKEGIIVASPRNTIFNTIPNKEIIIKNILKEKFLNSINEVLLVEFKHNDEYPDFPSYKEDYFFDTYEKMEQYLHDSDIYKDEYLKVGSHVLEAQITIDEIVSILGNQK